MYIMTICENYPENYWLNYKGDLTNNYFDHGELIENVADLTFEYYMENKISLERFLQYDVLYSNGPSIISPKLTNIFKENLNLGKDIQLIEVKLFVRSQLYEGYNIVNILNLEECIDINHSISEPLLSYLKDGPQQFTKITLKEKDSIHPLVRSIRAPHLIIVTDALKKILVSSEIKGVSFMKGF